MPTVSAEMAPMTRVVRLAVVAKAVSYQVKWNRANAAKVIKVCRSQRVRYAIAIPTATTTVANTMEISDCGTSVSGMRLNTTCSDAKACLAVACAT